MRVATYTRIFTDESRQPYSLEAQHTRLRAYVASQDGWHCVRAFTDQASGALMERPGLQRLVAEARAARFDLVLVYRVDRAARSVRGLSQLLDELERVGVGFRSATEPFDTLTAAGRMMAQMLGVFAEFERASMIDRVVAGMERKAAAGGWNGGARPFGYEIDVGGALVVREDEATVVLAIFERYTSDRLGARAIANLRNGEGHRAKSDRPWGHTSILTVLRNRVYLGEVPFRGTCHPGTHPPLVAHEMFDAAQAILNRRAADPGTRRSDSSDYLLAGLLRCEGCGARLLGNSAKGGRYRYYTCFSRHRYGKDVCNLPSLPAEDLDHGVLDALVKTYGPAKALREAVSKARRDLKRQRGGKEKEVARVAAEIVEVDGAIDRYLDAFERGTLPEARCAPRVAQLTESLDDLRRLHAELLAQLDLDGPPISTDDELGAVKRRVADAVQAASPRQLKTLLQAFVYEITITSRDDIVPVFRVIVPDQWPEGVDAPQVWEPSEAHPAGQHANPNALVTGLRMTISAPRHAKRRRDGYRRTP